MLKYILKRIAIFIPTLFVISLVTFYLSVNVPGDPVEQMLNNNSDLGTSTNAMASEKAYINKREQLGLNLPVFYFSFGSMANPPDLYTIPKKFHRQNLDRLIDLYGNWPQIKTYYESLKDFDQKVGSIPRDSVNADALIAIRDNIQKLFINYDNNAIASSFKDIKINLSKASSLQPADATFKTVENDYSLMQSQATVYKKYIPTVYWYGTQSQYHQSITKFMKGDFGISYEDQRPVKTIIWEALRWTVLLSVLSIILSYLIAVPLGVQIAARKDSKTDKTVSTFLYMLYSLPVFWVATLLIMFVCSNEFLGWFPVYGVEDVSNGDGFWAILGSRVYHLFIPMVCFTYGGLAFLFRQMRGAMVSTLTQDYIRTARAKGLDESKILWKHAFKNSLLPIITLFANVFPLIISGAIIIETKFSIPGMGKTAIQAIHARNYPMIYTIVMFSAILTMIGYLVADILYAVVDPRISYSKK